MLKFMTNPPLIDKSVVEGISGTANGCFAIKTDGKVHLYTADGIRFKTIEANDARILNDRSYFAQEFPCKSNLRTAAFLKDNGVWNLYAPDGTVLLSDCDTCKVYANGWYQTEKYHCRHLYNEKHQLVAKDYKQCFVFNRGYALRSNALYYATADMIVYAADGTYLRHISDVSEILGDGLFLVYHYVNLKDDHLQMVGDLIDPETGEKIVSNICAHKSFPNGRFVLTFENDTTGTDEATEKGSRMYFPDGQKLSARVTASTFLPDGHFISYQKRIIGIYRPNGIVKNFDVWSYEIAGNYYLLNYENTEILYNDKGEELGEGYELIAYEQNFALFENEQAYHLFNQNGNILSLDIPE